MTLPAFCPIAFNSPAAKPEIAIGSMIPVIMLYRSTCGSETVMHAYYLNGYPLVNEDGCDDCDEEHCEEGCPCSGWYKPISHPEYDEAFALLRGEVLAWARLPELNVVKALVTNTGGKPLC